MVYFEFFLLMKIICEFKITDKTIKPTNSTIKFHS